MKKVFAAAVAAVSLGLMAGGAHALTTFHFSYTFDTSQKVTGTFEGTYSTTTGLVSISSVDEVSIDNVALTGPLLAYSHPAPVGTVNCAPASCFVSSGAVASYNPLLNNFAFANGSSGDISSRTNYFYIIPWYNGPSNQVATQALEPNQTLIDPYNGNYIPGNWSLSVPEPATWAMMLIGLGAMGASLRVSRRRKIPMLTAA